MTAIGSGSRFFFSLFSGRIPEALEGTIGWENPACSSLGESKRFGHLWFWQGNSFRVVSGRRGLLFFLVLGLLQAGHDFGGLGLARNSECLPAWGVFRPLINGTFDHF